MDELKKLEMMEKLLPLRKAQLFNIGRIFGILAVIYLGVQTLSLVKQYDYIGQGAQTSNVISVQGEGEVFAVPDIAEISFSARAEKKTVGEAQKEVTSVMNSAIDFIKKSGIEERDIKTTNYNAYPKYEYQTSGTDIYIPRPGKQVITGYEVTHTITVKVRDTEKAGSILEGLGKLGVSDIYGPNFSIDDDEELRAEAREKAIDNAKEKADALAEDLGVRLVRIVSFTEGGYPYPVYLKAGAEGYGMGGDASSAPSVPSGENKIVSNVTITYEIK